MEIIFMLLVMLLALDRAVLKRGFDSRDGFGSPEWERLHDWQGFHEQVMISRASGRSSIDREHGEHMRRSTNDARACSQRGATSLA